MFPRIRSRTEWNSLFGGRIQTCLFLRDPFVAPPRPPWHTCRFELSSFSIEIFKIYAVIGICMKEFNHPIVQTCFFLPDPFVALPRPPWYTCQFELSSFSIEIFKIYAVIRICMKESNHPIVQICLFLRGGILLLPSKASLTLVDSNYRIFRSKFSRFRR